MYQPTAMFDTVTYNLCLLSMGAKGYPKALGLCMHPIPPVVVSRGQRELESPLGELTGGGSTKSPLEKGKRMNTVNFVSLGSALMAIL